VRRDGIFACPPSGYGSDGYLAYCQAGSYGDYDHGAFWFDLEPATRQAAARAQVLVLGNSRTQIGLSTAASAAWFSSQSVRYFLLGFSHNGNYKFEGPLLHRLGVQPEVYVINLDLFFDSLETPPARTVMRDGAARTRYEEKRMWQALHRTVCSSLPVACGDGPAFFRSRSTGTWLQRGGSFSGKPVSYDETIDPNVLRTYTAAGTGFLAHLPVRRECVILTIVPTVKTKLGTALAVAQALGLPLFAPKLEGLTTYDGSHLDPPSAERWSAAFLAAAGPGIRSCLGASPSAGAHG